MIETGKASIAVVLATCGLLGWACNPAAAAVHIEGQVQAGGGPLANSTVTLLEANAGEPKQLAQTQTVLSRRVLRLRGTVVVRVLFAVDRRHMRGIFIKVRPSDTKVLAVLVNPLPQLFT
jgi:hypothetical protein